jgi:biopolymer transport protein ExbD
MRYGHSHGVETKAEPDLTPMLDLVMNLLMFFIICANFVNEEVDDLVKLPKSEAAKPLEQAESNVLFVNLQPWRVKDFRNRLTWDAMIKARGKFREGDPCITIFGKDPMTLLELKFWLKQRYDDARKLSGKKDVNTAVVLRAHKDSDYLEVFRILDQVKTTGFKKLKLRAIVKTGVDLKNS